MTDAAATSLSRQPIRGSGLVSPSFSAFAPMMFLQTLDGVAE